MHGKLIRIFASSFRTANNGLEKDTDYIFEAKGLRYVAVGNNMFAKRSDYFLILNILQKPFSLFCR